MLTLCGRAGGVLVGRGAAGRGAGAARRSRAAGSGAVRFGVVVPDRPGVGGGCAGAGAAVDRDGDVRAVDGDQAAHRLGVRDAGPGGVGLAASAAVLSDRDRSAGAGRVDGPQARPPARRGGGAGDHQDGDREGAARDAVHRRGRRGSTRRWSRPTSAIRPTRCSPCREPGRSRARAASFRS